MLIINIIQVNLDSRCVYPNKNLVLYYVLLSGFFKDRRMDRYTKFILVSFEFREKKIKWMQINFKIKGSFAYNV